MMDDEPGGESGGERRNGAPLPVTRAFVMQLTPDTALVAGRFQGRVEHIETGQAHRFASLDDLMAFIAGVLEPNEPERPA